MQFFSAGAVLHRLAAAYRGCPRWARRALLVLELLSCGLAALGAAYGFAITQFGWGDTSDIYYNTAVRGAELLAISALAVLFVARPTVWSTE